MAVNAVNTEYAAAGYRNNSVAGLDDQQMLIKGLHGLVVYIHRAKLIVETEGGADKSVSKVQHLAKADQLIGFLLKLADADTEMGSTLIRCYTGIQQLLASALTSTDTEESVQALEDALGQARELERAFKEIGDDANGQAH